MIVSCNVVLRRRNMVEGTTHLNAKPPIIIVTKEFYVKPNEECNW